MQLHDDGVFFRRHHGDTTIPVGEGAPSRSVRASGPSTEATPWVARFGSKVIAVNTALKVVFIGLAVAVLLVP